MKIKELDRTMRHRQCSYVALRWRFRWAKSKKTIKMIIFISGIHASGKGTICKEIQEKTEYKHFTASELIKWKEISPENQKGVKNISSTQERLLNALSVVKEDHLKILLDGHFVLFNSDLIPSAIDIKVFEDINPNAIICIEGDVEIIQQRLYSRDHINYDLDILKTMQNLELAKAKECSLHLGVPLLIYGSEEPERLLTFINSL
ncbi:hypothetical protein CEQ90_19255 [Lewinellaceae bacterium SD302]|nr:hypothetical protein CEQ90_19255 [Lewinellaceae bacterium SD302]